MLIDFVSKYLRIFTSVFGIQDFNLQTKTLENYFLIVSAIEDNLVEFKKIKEQLNEVTSLNAVG